MATITNIMSSLVRSQVKSNDPISDALVKQFRKVSPETTLGLISRILEKDSFVLVTKQDLQKEQVIGLITNIDLLNYITENENKLN